MSPETRARSGAALAQAQRPEAATINIPLFRSAPLVRDPYEHVIVPGFVYSEMFEAIVRDYPPIAKRGSFPLESLQYGPRFAQLLDELRSDAFRHAVEEKFSVNLIGRPTIITVRGMCGRKDGKIHTDTQNKIITVLLYMNYQWENEGGKLRLLRSNDLDDVAAEVPPAAGTLLAFKRSDRSFHGHKLFIGTRRVIQLNWVTDQKFVDYSNARHSWSSVFKKLNPFGKTEQY